MSAAERRGKKRSRADDAAASAAAPEHDAKKARVTRTSDSKGADKEKDKDDKEDVTGKSDASNSAQPTPVSEKRARGRKAKDKDGDKDKESAEAPGESAEGEGKRGVKRRRDSEDAATPRAKRVPRDADMPAHEPPSAPQEEARRGRGARARHHTPPEHAAPPSQGAGSEAGTPAVETAPVAGASASAPKSERKGARKKRVSLAQAGAASAAASVDAAQSDAGERVRLEEDAEWRPRSLTLRAKTGVFVRPEYRCYCNSDTPSTGEKGDVVCDGCNRVFHQRCLSRSLDVAPLPGDVCYEFLCRVCHARRGGSGEKFTPLAKTWLDVAEVALYNLTLEAQSKTPARTAFGIADDLVPFIDAHWYTLCYGLEKARSWENQLRSTLQGNPLFFTLQESSGSEKWGLVTSECPIFLDKSRSGRETLSIAAYEAMRTEELRASRDRLRAKQERKRRTSEARKQLKAGLSQSQDLAASQGHSGAEEPYEEPTFEVERIIGKRVDAQGRVQYRIKWVGFDNRYNSWVAPENMDAEEKIREYEAQLALTGSSELSRSQESKGKKASQPPLSLSASANKDEDSGPITGADETPVVPSYTKLLRRSKRYYERGDVVKRVVGMNRIDEQLAINVEWIGHRKRSWMLASTLAEKDPSTLIRYYESKIKFQLAPEASTSTSAAVTAPSSSS